MNTPAYTLGELADRFELRLRGNAQQPIRGVSTLADADAGQITFLANPRYRAQLAQTRAGAVVLREADAAAREGACLIAGDPYVAFARIAALFERAPAHTPGVHPSAVVASGARVADGASIGAYCVIEDGAVIADGAQLGPHCIIGPRCTVGAQSRLVARVTLVQDVTIGQRVLIHPGAVLGADGFGLAFDRDHWVKVPQLGGVVIGDDCEIGANTTIDRGALGNTVLEEDVRLDNLIQIAHNVRVGAHTAMAAFSGVSGSATVGRYCLLAGGVGIVGHVTVADHVTLTARAVVSRSLDAAGEYSSGTTPLQPHREWLRNAARFRHLDDIARRVEALEKKDSHS